MMTVATPVMLLEALRETFSTSGHAVVNRMMTSWPENECVSEVSRANNHLPVVDYLPLTLEHAAPQAATLAQTLNACRDRLFWQQTYTAQDLGQAFLDLYGWTLLVGPGALLDSPNVLSGFLLLGPGVEYPVHTHSAEEIYLVVSGSGSWSVGSADWQVKPPGSIFHNPPYQPHGIRTHAEPLVLAYLWSASALEKSTFLNRGNQT
mgnify:CR=1 FL=1